MTKTAKNNGRTAVLEAPETEERQANTVLPVDLFERVAAAAKQGERSVAGQMRIIVREWADKQQTP